jgi:hypothetical protein
MKKLILLLTFTVILSLQVHASIDIESLIDSDDTSYQQRENIRSKLDSGININRKHSRENVSLLACVYEKYKDSEAEDKDFYENIVMDFLERGALVHENGKEYTSAIFKAVYYKDTKFVSIFLSFLPTVSPLDTAETLKDSIGDNLMHRLLRPPLVASSKEVLEVAQLISTYQPFAISEKNTAGKLPLDIVLSMSGYRDIYRETVKDTFIHLWPYQNIGISTQAKNDFYLFHNIEDGEDENIIAFFRSL